MRFRALIEVRVEDDRQTLGRWQGQGQGWSRAGDRRDERADREIGGHRRRRAGRAEISDADDPDTNVPSLLRSNPGGRLQGEERQTILGVEDGRAGSFASCSTLGDRIDFLTIDPIQQHRQGRDAVRRGTCRIEP
jgi:hypothetical protein